MKKIGILTFQNAINYGAVLQCLALQETIKKENNNVVVINYQSKNIKNSNKLLNFSSVKTLIKDFIFLPFNVFKSIKYKKFIKEYLNVTDKVFYDNFLDYVNNNMDTVIVGSDQVWNSKLIKDEENIYFLKDVIIEKNSYSASLGNLTSENLDNVVSFTDDFCNVSVREQDIKDVLKEKYDKNVEVTLDPTLLLKKNDWEKLLVDKKFENKDNYGLVYLLQQNPLFDKIASYLISNNFVDKIFTFSKKKLKVSNCYNKITADPKEFINMFYNSSYVITNSFHGLAFSIIFEKQFFVLLPNEREGRLVSLLSKLNLKNRIISDISELPNVLNDVIDYKKVNVLLEKERVNSINYLKKILGK